MCNIPSLPCSLYTALWRCTQVFSLLFSYSHLGKHRTAAALVLVVLLAALASTTDTWKGIIGITSKFPNQTGNCHPLVFLIMLHLLFRWCTSFPAIFFPSRSFAASCASRLSCNGLWVLLAVLCFLGMCHVEMEAWHWRGYTIWLYLSLMDEREKSAARGCNWISEVDCKLFKTILPSNI